MTRPARVIVALLALAWAPAGRGQDVALVVGEPRVISLRVAAPDYDYRVLGDVAAKRERGSNQRQLKLTLTARSAGTAYVVVACADEAGLLPLGVVTLRATGATPAPPPGPPSPPDPQPVPGGKLYLAVVRDPAATTPEVALLLGDTPFWDSLKAKGHEWDFFASAVPAGTDPAEAKRRGGYLAKAGAVQDGPTYTPALLVIDQATGKTLKVVRLPKDKAGVLEAIK